MKKLNLRALIRLAVNNANEAEAGRAAIRVCKALLEQDKTILNAENDEKGATPSAPSMKKEATIRVSENPRTRDITITVTGLDMVNNSRVARLIQELDKELRGARGTWNDVHRSTEPMWSSTYPPKPPKPEPPKEKPPRRERHGFGFDFGSIFNDLKWDIGAQPTPEDYATGKKKPYDPTEPSNYSKSRPPRKLKCKTCGNDVETQFVGPPQVFECADCWGKDIKL